MNSPEPFQLGKLRSVGMLGWVQTLPFLGGGGGFLYGEMVGVLVQPSAVKTRI